MQVLVEKLWVSQKCLCPEVPPSPLWCQRSCPPHLLCRAVGVRQACRHQTDLAAESHWPLALCQVLDSTLSRFTHSEAASPFLAGLRPNYTALSTLTAGSQGSTVPLLPVPPGFLVSRSLLRNSLGPREGHGNPPASAGPGIIPAEKKAPGRAFTWTSTPGRQRERERSRNNLTGRGMCETAPSAGDQSWTPRGHRGPGPTPLETQASSRMHSSPHWSGTHNPVGGEEWPGETRAGPEEVPAGGSPAATSWLWHWSPSTWQSPGGQGGRW